MVLIERTSIVERAAGPFPFTRKLSSLAWLVIPEIVTFCGPADSFFFPMRVTLAPSRNTVTRAILVDNWVNDLPPEIEITMTFRLK